MSKTPVNPPPPPTSPPPPRRPPTKPPNKAFETPARPGPVEAGSWKAGGPVSSRAGALTPRPGAGPQDPPDPKPIPNPHPYPPPYAG